MSAEKRDTDSRYRAKPKGYSAADFLNPGGNYNTSLRTPGKRQPNQKILIIQFVRTLTLTGHETYKLLINIT